MSMTITIKGVDMTKEHLAKFATAMSDLSPTMARLGELLSKYYSGEAFVSQGGVYGQRWTPLASATVAYKSRFWPGRGPEVRSGDLQNGFGYTVTPLSVTIRNKVEVGRYNLLSLQQNGTERGIPPRTIMALNETLRAEASAIVHEDIAIKLQETN